MKYDKAFWTKYFTKNATKKVILQRIQRTGVRIPESCRIERRYFNHIQLYLMLLKSNSPNSNFKPLTKLNMSFYTVQLLCYLT